MTTLRSVPIWSGWLRLSHALTGGAVLALLASGWLMANAPALASDARDAHDLAAGVLVAGLLLRLWRLLSGGPVERLSQWMPGDREWPAVGRMLRFYLTLGRAPLPRWHAHNPFWKPLYLLLHLLLLVLLFTGATQRAAPLLGGVYLPDVHRVFAAAAGWLVLAHLVAATWHDARGTGSDVSAMIHGRRIFVVDPPRVDSPALREAAVRLDDIAAPASRPSRKPSTGRPS